MDYLAIIERIEVRLQEIKMGKMEFYESVGISPNSYSLWKKGITKPTTDNLERIAIVLGWSIQTLMFGEDWQKEKAHPLNESELDNELIKLLVDLTPSEMLQVSAYIAGLKANRKA